MANQILMLICNNTEKLYGLWLGADCNYLFGMMMVMMVMMMMVRCDVCGEQITYEKLTSSNKGQ